LYRLRDGRFAAITARNGLTTEVTSILDDGKGHLWLPSEHGIFRLALKEVNDIADGRISSIGPFSYGVAEGMKTSECNGGVPGACKARDGRLWFPTMRGVVAIDPDSVNEPPPVVIEEAWANKVKLGSDGRTAVPAGNNMLDFTFTALNLSAPERQRFKYRLQPYDKGWVDAGAQRTAHYTNMAPGEYSFHVIAANSYGIWNEQGANLRFVLQPHFYQTSWFYALCATTLLALLWAAYQFRVHQLQRAFNMRLEERIEERSRIARELHDTLLQSFQGLMFSFQAARNLLPGRTEEAIRTLDVAIRKGDEAVAEGRDAIQNLRLGSAQRRLEDLLAATGQELRDAQDGNGHSAAFQVTMEGQPRTLSPLLQDEIYRIAREVLRNAFQHADAQRIEAAIQYDPDKFRLRIRDDGKGIDPAVLQEGARAGHWGLPGMRERAKRIGARLTLWSESGAGTEVELTVPAAVAYAASRPRRRFGLFRSINEDS
jgi:signal transduction histidine kinase